MNRLRNIFVRIPILRTAYHIIKKAKLWHQPRTRGLMEHYALFIKKGDLCFDIGANMGARTEIFLGLGASVVALEPQKSCVDFLKNTFHGYPLTIIEKAVGKQPGTATLHFSESASVLATLSHKWQNEGRFAGTDSWKKEQPVEVTTLDMLIAEYGTPHFCKIDVEGFEKEVIAGLTSAIPALSFEFTREFIDDARSIMVALDRLAPYEYNFSLGENHELATKDWATADDLLRRFDQHPMTDLWGDIYARIAT